MSTEQPNNIRIALAQCNIFDSDPLRNLQKIEEILQTHSNLADLIIFPEAILTGFSEEAMTHGEDWEHSPQVKQLIDLSKRYNTAIACSIFVIEAGRHYNRFLLIDRELIGYQDKRHLFRMGGEAKVMHPCTERRVLLFRGWRILPVICYDLRFPVWCRCRENDYDLMICVANWPRGRRSVWQTLLVARAMENLSYVIGVNRIGTDASSLSYAGDSAVLSPRGEVLGSCQSDNEEVVICELSYSPLAELRRKFPVWMDADSFTIN